MSMRTLAWAWNEASEPPASSDFRNGHGRLYQPMAKLMLIALANYADHGDGDNTGEVRDFRALCEHMWISCNMATRVVEQLHRDGLVRIIEASWVNAGDPEFLPNGIIIAMRYELAAGDPRG